MKAHTVLVVLMLLFSASVMLGQLGLDEPGAEGDASPGTAVDGDRSTDTSEGDFNPQPEQEFENDPMTMVLNSRRADEGPYFLDFRQVSRGVTAVASIEQGEEYARNFRYPYQPGQKVSSKYDENLEATLDIYVNSVNVPGKTVRFKVEIDRDGDGFNDTTIDFPPFTTQYNASPEHVVRTGTVYFREPDVSQDMDKARIYLNVWRTDTIEDKNNRLKVYCGFLSDTEIGLQSYLYLPWVNPVPSVAIDAPLDYNTTGKTYYNNEDIFFDGRSSRDPSEDALNFVWTFDRLEYPPVYDRELFNRSFKKPGWYTITLNVSNSLYFTNETSVTILVLYKNHPPKLTPKLETPSGLFEPVPDEITTYTYVNQHWLASITDIDEDPVTIKWNFGDGFTSTSAELNHSYKVPGQYVLTVEAFDGNETSGRVKKTIVVNVEPNHEPIGVIEVSGAPYEIVTPPKGDEDYRGMEVRVNMGDRIIFDASKSYDPDGLPIQRFEWNFDDVYATEENPTVASGISSSHRFLVEGEYNVTLELFDGVKKGITHVWIRTNNAPISVPPGRISAYTGDIVTFSAERSNDPDTEDTLMFKWDFGDNTRTDWSESWVSKHTYSITAQYTATLYVSDGLLQHTGNTPVNILPMNHQPEARLSLLDDPDDLWTNMTIRFSSTGSYDIDGEGRISFSWDFGDNSDPNQAANPTHVYSTPGTYTVTLTVIDTENTIDTDTLTITVQRNYGDTDIIFEALTSTSSDDFYDPDPSNPDVDEVAVMREGWVAYKVDVRQGESFEVKINVIGDRKLDAYLLRETYFQQYRRNPEITFVPFEADGYKQGFTGEFKYTFEPRESDRYYVIIDNKDMPLGTETEGPVDYTVQISPKWETGEDSFLSPGLSSVAAMAAIVVMAAVAVAARRRD